MALADFQLLVDDMVTDQGAVITPDVRDRAIEQARVRYSADCERERHEAPQVGGVPGGAEQAVAFMGKSGSSAYCSSARSY